MLQSVTTIFIETFSYYHALIIIHTSVTLKIQVQVQKVDKIQNGKQNTKW